MNEVNLYSSSYVANRIKEYSKIKKISLKSLLENCNLGSNTFSHMLHDKAIAFDSLAKIADCLNCSVDYLLGRVDSPNGTYSISNQNTTINGTQANVINNSTAEKTDTLTDEFMQKFKNLSFEEKIDVMQYVNNKKSAPLKSDTD